jgi:hypothetical protein
MSQETEAPYYVIFCNFLLLTSNVIEDQLCGSVNSQTYFATWVTDLYYLPAGLTSLAHCVITAVASNYT